MSYSLQNKRVLLIGGSGGIGRACLEYLQQQSDIASVTVVSRREIDLDCSKTSSVVLKSPNQDNISQTSSRFPDKHFDLVICTLGVLHDSESGLSPEKKLEDINEQAMQRYFQVNCILPGLWLSALVNKMNPNDSQMVFLSARVVRACGPWYHLQSLGRMVWLPFLKSCT